MIRLEHPEHGAMHVTNKAEAEYNAKFGWREVREPAPVKSVTKVVQPPESLPILELKEKYRKKFGKKPHWNLNRHNIEKALNGNGE